MDYIEKKQLVVREVRRILKENGIFILLLHHAPSIISALRRAEKVLMESKFLAGDESLFKSVKEVLKGSKFWQDVLNRYFEEGKRRRDKLIKEMLRLRPSQRDREMFNEFIGEGEQFLYINIGFYASSSIKFSQIAIRVRGHFAGLDIKYPVGFYPGSGGDVEVPMGITNFKRCVFGHSPKTTLNLHNLL